MKYIKVSGEKIREARKSKGLTQAALGELLGVSGSMIGQYETEARRPNFKTAEAVAAALGIDKVTLMVEFEADDLRSINVAAISKTEMELLLEKDRIEQNAPVAVQEAKTLLLKKIDDICTDYTITDEAKRLHQLTLMPSRISLVTDFLEANKSFLRKNMPGMSPDDK